jgi:hypothetical protein
MTSASSISVLAMAFNFLKPGCIERNYLRFLIDLFKSAPSQLAVQFLSAKGEYVRECG